MALSPNAERLQAWLNMYGITADQYEAHLNACPKVVPHGAFTNALAELLSGDGTLYGITADTIVLIDKVTGEVTELGSITPSLGICAFASNPNDRLLYRLGVSEAIVFQKIDPVTLDITEITVSGDTISGTPRTMSWYNDKFIFETDANEFATITANGVITFVSNTDIPAYAGYRYVNISGGVFPEEGVNVLFGVLTFPPLFGIIVPETLLIDSILGPGAITDGTIEGLTGSLKMNAFDALTISNDGNYAYVISEISDEVDATAVCLIRLFTPQGNATAISRISTDIKQLTIL